MKRLWIAVSIGSMLAASGWAETWSGVISDSACGAKHEAGTESDAACVKSCVKSGKAAVFVSGGKVYQISVDSREKVSSHLGRKVTVNGKLEGDTVTIESVEPVKD